MARKKFTWDDLAKEISKLPKDVRKSQVMISVEDESKFKIVNSLEITEQDIYCSKDDYEDCGSIEDLKELHGKEFNYKEYKLSTIKGTPFLWDGF